MNAFKANIGESAKIISGQNEKDKDPTYKRRRHESIDSQESIPNKPKKSRKDSTSEGQKEMNPADANLEDREEELELELEEKTGDGNDQKDSNLEEDREEDTEEKTGDGDDQEKKEKIDDKDNENLDETAAEIAAVQKVTAKSSNDEDHDTSIN